MINILKNKIKRIIKENSYREITANTDFKSKGIYMIYIDNFEDDKTIPIYIGQTNRDFQTRYKEHFTELMALNRLEYGYYKKLLLNNFYDGNLRACKIFKYMVDHNCTLKDFHMIIIEEVDCSDEKIKDVLDSKEQMYFKEFLSAFFGFNQILSLTEGIKLFFKSFKDPNIYFYEETLEYQLNDSENFIKYFGYGYTKFNYYHSFPSEPSQKEVQSDIEKKLEKNKKILYEKYVDPNKFAKSKKRLKNVLSKLQDLEPLLSKELKEIKEKYFTEIEKYCRNNKIDLRNKINVIKDLVIFPNTEGMEKFKIYLKKKNIAENIVEKLLNNITFEQLRKSYVSNLKLKEDLIKEKRKLLYVERTDNLLRLLPKEKYNVLPLKDNYQEFEFHKMGIYNNYAIINFEFSHNSSIDDLYNCSLIKMDYIVCNNRITIRKNLFIDSEFLRDKSIKYYEENLRGFNRIGEPFKIKRYPDYISTNMEFQNGINDYTYRKFRKHKLEDSLDEVNKLINEETEIIILLRPRMKKFFLNYIKDNYNKENILKVKLLKLKNK